MTTTLIDALSEWIGDNVDGLNKVAAAGGNVFVDDLPAGPDLAIGIYHAGGVQADSALPYDSPNLAITVRGTKDSRTAKDLWYALYNKLHGLRSMMLPGGIWLVSCLAIQSAPVRMGTDENGRHQYVLNLECEVLNPTAERP